MLYVLTRAYLYHIKFSPPPLRKCSLNGTVDPQEK